MYEKNHFTEQFREFNFGHTISIRKGDILYFGCIDTYKVTKFYKNFDECLNATRKLLENMNFKE